jgi:hypothetical protein
VYVCVRGSRVHITCCEVSEPATHHLSPHGPCKPPARVTGRARTYAMNLPKWDSTLPEAASKRDQCSPHHPHCLPAIRPRSCTLVTRTRPFPTIWDSQCLPTTRHLREPGAPHTQTAFITTRRSATGYNWSPAVARTACLTPTHRTRQRISRHSLSPTSHDASTSRGRPFVSPPS